MKDEFFIRRCITLAERSLAAGAKPFGCVITKGNKLFVDSQNDAKTRISNHAELMALHKAQDKLGKRDLSTCTLYSSCEPCPMCSFMIRECKIKRVVFAKKSPIMGGYSRWNILQDRGLARVKPFFGEPPEVIAGMLENEAEKTFEKAGMKVFVRDKSRWLPVWLERAAIRSKLKNQK